MRCLDHTTVIAMVIARRFRKCNMGDEAALIREAQKIGRAMRAGQIAYEMYPSNKGPLGQAKAPERAVSAAEFENPQAD